MSRYFLITRTADGVESLRLPHTITDDPQALPLVPPTGWVRLVRMTEEGAEEIVHERDE